MDRHQANRSRRHIQLICDYVIRLWRGFESAHTINPDNSSNRTWLCEFFEQLGFGLFVFAAVSFASYWLAREASNISGVGEHRARER